MIFAPDLATAVMEGRKTVTRRPLSDNPRSPWWRERCALTPGSTRAVQPGRGQAAIGRVRIVSVRREPLAHVIRNREWEREGFPTLIDFDQRWREMYGPRVGRWLDDVWRVEFEVVEGG